MTELALWLLIFGASLFVLVKGADYFIAQSEKIGLSFGLSPFVIGVLIMGVGTSLPELVTAFAAIISGATEIVVASAVGSNVANTLLILGIAAIVTKNITVENKSLIYLDVPLLAASTVIFLGVAVGKETFALEELSGHIISKREAVFLLLTYLIYLGYVLFHKDDYVERLKALVVDKPDISWKNYAFLLGGLAGIIFGAKYVVTSTLALSELFGIGVGVISMFAIALGTSLPELSVSLRSISQGKTALAVGNVFGSNIFNVLVLVGIPGLFTTLAIDNATLMVGLPALAIATLVFAISSISNKVHLWDGSMFLMIYALFVAKLFGII